MFACFLGQKWWLVGITLTQALAAGSQESISTLSRYVLHVHVLVQFILGLNFMFLSFWVWECMIMSEKQREIEFTPGIKANRNIRIELA